MYDIADYLRLVELLGLRDLGLDDVLSNESHCKRYSNGCLCNRCQERFVGIRKA